MKRIFGTLSILAIALLSSCSTFVSQPDAQRFRGEYHRELQALDSLSLDYASLVHSSQARSAWAEAAQSTPDLDRLVSAWAFATDTHIDTGLPQRRKAVVIPGVALHPVVKRQWDGELAWGRSGDLISVKKAGTSGTLIAFFR